MEKIGNVLDGKYYVIPKHQRGFSWYPQNVRDIFDDLQLAHNHSHYMGPLIVARTSKPDFQDDNLNTTAEYELEDGQQRLTALMLVLGEIASRLRQAATGDSLEARQIDQILFFQKNGINNLRLQNSNADLHGVFNSLLTGQQFTPSQYTPPVRSLYDVYKTIKEHYDGPEWTEKDLVHEKNRFSNQMKFVWVDLATEGINRYLAFDAINSRGLPLSEFDKIKNFCILVCEELNLLGMVDPSDKWYKAIGNLEQFGVGYRSFEDAFVAELYSIFHNERVTQGKVHSEFVAKYRILLAGYSNDPGLKSQFVEFVQLWESYSRSFAFIASTQREWHYANQQEKKALPWLWRLDKMDLPTISRPILASVHHEMAADSDLHEVARSCEIYTFRTYAVMGYRKDMNSKGIISLAHEILRSGCDSHYVKRVFCTWLSRYAPLSDVVHKLGDGGVKYYYDKDSKGWPHCYYFLYEYELYHSPAGSPAVSWVDNPEKKANSIEHILPQNHRDGGFWESHWPDEAMADKFKHRLGNMVLTRENAGLGRKSIGEKLNSSDGSYSYLSNSATNTEKRIVEFTSGSTWTASEIVSRELAMLRFAVERWSVPCCADNGGAELPDSFDPSGVFAGSVIDVYEDACVAEIDAGIDLAEQGDEESVDEGEL